MNTTDILPLWAQIIIALCLLISAIFTLTGAIGLVRFKDFYMRMHPTAIVTTIGAWSCCIAAAIYLSFLEGKIAWYILILIPLIIVTAPITTAILARAVLFRWRGQAHPAPPALSYTIAYGSATFSKIKTEENEANREEDTPKKKLSQPDDIERF